MQHTPAGPVFACFIGWAIGRKEVEINGTTAEFRVRTNPELEHFSSPLYHERPMLKHLLKTVGKSDVFYDIGANIGLYSCLVGESTVPQPEIVSLEPFPPNVRRLRENLKLNGVCSDVKQIALSNQSGVSEFRIDERNTPGSGRGRLTKSGGNTITVATKRGDELQGIPEPTIVKIDVEGAERDVIDGMKNTLRNSIEHVYCECHQEEINCVADKLEELDFSTDILYQDENRVFLYGHSRVE